LKTMNRTENSEDNFAGAGLEYLERINSCFNENNLNAIEGLAKDLLKAWIEGRRLYICGNGGSAANALHIANDLHYGIGASGESERIVGLRVEALPANIGIVSCLANDIGYENIYAHQIEAKGAEGDILIALSGSGNSENIVRAIKTAKRIGIKSYAILGYSGGKCKHIADIPIHFMIDDMQVAEDTQMIVGHIVMQWLAKNKHRKIAKNNKEF